MKEIHLEVRVWLERCTLKDQDGIYWDSFEPRCSRKIFIEFQVTRNDYHPAWDHQDRTFRSATDLQVQSCRVPRATSVETISWKFLTNLSSSFFLSTFRFAVNATLVFHLVLPTVVRSVVDIPLNSDQRRSWSSGFHPLPSLLSYHFFLFRFSLAFLLHLICRIHNTKPSSLWERQATSFFPSLSFRFFSCQKTDVCLNWIKEMLCSCNLKPLSIFVIE